MSPSTLPRQTGPSLSIENNSAPSSPIATKDGKKAEQQTPPSPRSSGPSFLQSALRRLSSSGGGMGKMNEKGGLCPRRVMNVDPYRERCNIEELQPSKLRRVSFCVDVEIAGHAAPPEEDESPSVPSKRPGTAETDKQAGEKKTKEERAKTKEKAEGEALKRPQAVAENKENTGDIETTEETTEKTSNPVTEQAVDGEKPVVSRKREKKKRSEEERKERKEKKRLAALANGSIPLEIIKDSSSSGAPSGTSTPVRPQDRPTTDPLRIYKRCCQLRETPVLKKVADQLSLPNACDDLSYGTVTCLDLSGYHMQFSDLITLGDYLAVVPVRKLILEDCGLTDEAVRVILSGLLSVKTPAQAKFNRSLNRVAGEKSEKTEDKTEQLGVVEKLCLKNNPKIGPEGWKHISFFINMSRSLKAIELSMIPFPWKPDLGSTPNQHHHHQNHHHHHHLHSKNQSPPKSVVDVATTFEKCLIDRRAGSRLEELVMAECGLSTEVVKKIVNAVQKCGVTRLGLANNKLDEESFQSICEYLRGGGCEGLDLGGNPLSEGSLKLLTEAIQAENNKLYALSLAECSLSASSLKDLIPALARLQNFRFIDLSHNRRLFATQPNAISMLRRYLPRMRMMKRINLNDVAMEPEHCIALAEILPEIPLLAHLSILENPAISALASASDEASREEACALFASLMVAVRVSETIVSIDVDIPKAEAGEIVQALAKQVVAYSLRNLVSFFFDEMFLRFADSIRNAVSPWPTIQFIKRK
jgi:hypothetical protein